MSHVFISYKRTESDKRLVKKMREKLGDAGFEAWIDTKGLRAGEDWREAIDQAIRDALAIIVILTPDAVKSPYVTYEWAFAFGLGKEVIPVLYKQTEPHPRLAGIHYFDFTGQLGRHPWEELINRLREIEDDSVSAPLRPSRNALNSSNSRERREAVESIAQSNDPAALGILIAALRNHYQDVRTWSAEALERSRRVEAVPGLIEGLCDRTIGGAATVALLQMGNAAVPQLIEAFKTQKDDTARKEIVAVLNKIGGINSLLCLKEALHDPYAGVREEAASGLGNVGDAEVVPDLLNAAHDKDQEVRFRAIQALGKLGDPRAIPVFLEAVEDKYDHIWKAALEGLSAWRDPSIAPALAERLMHSDSRVKCEIISVLWHLGETSVVPKLIECLEDESPKVRAYTAMALGNLRDKRAIPSLIEALDDSDNDVRQNAADALRRMVTVDDIPTLLAVLGNGTERVKRTIGLYILGHMKDRGDDPTNQIPFYLNSDDPAIRAGAKIASDFLGGPEGHEYREGRPRE